jgi:hypothetical protein
MDDTSQTIPLVLGVTGHRDLLTEEIPAIKASAKRFFLQLQNTFPDLPILLMSPLAEGADQVISEVAFEMGIPVTALLPMPLDLYQEDFSGPALETFNQLLASCDVIEMPLLNGTTNNNLPRRESRDLQYTEMGAYLAAHSHILLAVWDGKDSHWPGGTSRVIHFHQYDSMDTVTDGEQLSPVNFTDDESDLVYHIPCSRRSVLPKLPEELVGSGNWLTRDSITPRTINLPERYLSVFQRLGEFNRDTTKLKSTSYGDLIPEEHFEHADPGAQLIARLHAQADLMARHFQTRMMLSINIGFSLILLAGLSFIVYADLISDARMIYIYLILVSLIFTVFAWERRSGWRRKYLDYRVLAEALRVQFYWSVAGVKSNRPHRFCHDSFHERRDLELGWIRNVMRYSGRRSDALPNDLLPNRDDDNVSLVIQYWIGNDESGQRNYYRTKSQQRARTQGLTRVLEISAFSTVICMTVLLVILPSETPFANYLIAAIGLLPFIVAVRQNYAHQTAERELITQYNYYYQIFSNAQRLIEHTDNTIRKRHILRALGEAALDESSQWILRQRERPRSGSMM